MADGGWSREHYGEAFWRAHHEAWQQSDLNQREYCEAVCTENSDSHVVVMQSAEEWL